MSYIFNKNHNRSHEPNCRAVKMMNFDKNAETVEEPRGHGCGWCGTSGGYINYPSREQDTGLDPYIGERICHDPTIRTALKKNGCSCGSHQLDARMYPHHDGVKIAGESGRWWVYGHCLKCGHDTSISKIPESFLKELSLEVE